jgi:hypothetical protein
MTSLIFSGYRSPGLVCELLRSGVHGFVEKTAQNHRANLMRKLDLHDVASLTRYAINHDLIVIGN